MKRYDMVMYLFQCHRIGTWPRLLMAQTECHADRNWAIQYTLGKHLECKLLLGLDASTAQLQAVPSEMPNLGEHVLSPLQHYCLGQHQHLHDAPRLGIINVCLIHM